MAKILIAGGTGFIGKHLCNRLLKEGHDINCLTRTNREDGNIKFYKWDISKGEIDIKAFEGIDVIIQLTGEGIADKRWTDKRKKELLDSRVDSTRLLIKGLKESGAVIKKFIGASAIGYYGAVTCEKEFKEEDGPGNDFVAELCVKWENEYKWFKENDVATYVFRIGIVLSQDGGAFKKMSTLFKYGLGAPIGSGKQIMPWIHIDDLVEAFLNSINGKLNASIYNLVAPERITNKEFSKILAGYWKRWLIPIHVPAFLFRMLYGEMAVILLEGTAISSDKIMKSKTLFNFQNLKDIFLSN
ncbi:MAG: TIGR01777 family oxidoreductase [Bacteroidia bacterium]